MPSIYMMLSSHVLLVLVISDHALVYIDIEIGKTVPETRYWRLNVSA
jgi:hypothetical protein